MSSEQAETESPFLPPACHVMSPVWALQGAADQNNVVHTRGRKTFYCLFVKRAIDILGASVLLVLLLPVFGIVAFSIWWNDGWPVLFRQQRLGEGLRSFKLLKFRTMVRNAEGILKWWEESKTAHWKNYVENNFKIPEDPRLLRCGYVLRRFSLDELPQLLNVIRGDMSLVGPRPLLASELPDYASCATDVSDYSSVRPGMTGLWQVSGRSSTKFADRARLDFVYRQNITFIGDVKILVRTVLVVFHAVGAY